jgi:hypothetical protein
VPHAILVNQKIGNYFMSAARRGRPRLDESSPSPIVQRLKDATGWRTEEEICRHVGCNLSTLYRQKKREREFLDGTTQEGMTHDFLWDLARASGCRLEYLRDGDGPPFEVPQLRAPLDTLVDIAMCLPHASKLALVNCAKVLDCGDGRIVKRMLGHIAFEQDSLEIRSQFRADLDDPV